MKSLVYCWREHFIGYDTSPILDAHFMHLAAETFERQRDWHGIGASFRFGSITGTELSAVSALLSSIYIKHIFFCIEYMQKFPTNLFHNVLTIFAKRKDLVNDLSAFANQIQNLRPDGTEAIYRLDRKNVYRSLSASRCIKETSWSIAGIFIVQFLL
jgi:hypothetical protein